MDFFDQLIEKSISDLDECPPNIKHCRLMVAYLDRIIQLPWKIGCAIIKKAASELDMAEQDPTMVPKVRETILKLSEERAFYETMLEATRTVNEIKKQNTQSKY